MPAFRRKADKAVEHRPSKYDGFKIVSTGKTYRHQKGSGRSVCFGLAKDGMLISKWTELCAKEGFDAKFVTGSLKKLHGAEYAAWKFSDRDKDGKTLAEVTKQREVKAKTAGAKKAPAKKKPIQAKSGKKPAGKKK